MSMCPECKGEKGYSQTFHDQSCVFDEVCERHHPQWHDCPACHGSGELSGLALAIYKARGGPAPTPFRGYA